MQMWPRAMEPAHESHHPQPAETETLRDAADFGEGGLIKDEELMGLCIAPTLYASAGSGRAWPVCDRSMCPKKNKKWSI
jgi:hypothetical protein